MKATFLSFVILLAACQKENLVVVNNVPVFYRIAVYDLDGTVSYSKVVATRFLEVLSESRGKGKDKDEECILPLTFKYFYAQPRSRDILLQWETSYESNIDKLVIERSFNAVDYKPIAKIPPRGANVIYSYVD